MTLKEGKTTANDKEPVFPHYLPLPKKILKSCFVLILAFFFPLENILANILFSLSVNWKECSFFCGLWCVCVYMGDLWIPEKRRVL